MLFDHPPTAGALYTAVVAMHRWRDARRRHAPTGLYTWANALQSGVDNNVSIVCSDGASAAAGGGQAAGGEAPLAVDSSAFVVAGERALARVAAALGRPPAEAAAWTAAADDTAAAMRRWLWCAPDGTYYNRRAGSGGGVPSGKHGWVRRVTYSNYAALYARRISCPHQNGILLEVPFLARSLNMCPCVQMSSALGCPTKYLFQNSPVTVVNLEGLRMVVPSNAGETPVKPIAVWANQTQNCASFVRPRLSTFWRNDNTRDTLDSPPIFSQ